jgi:hypothetical protein
MEPFLQKLTDTEKATVLCNMFRLRYADGKREKTAHWMVAAIKKHFAMSHMSIGWMDLPMVTMARKACRRSPLENRAYVKGEEGKAKLPVWQGLLDKMRDRLWTSQDWQRNGMDNRMVYLAAMYSFDLATRASEVTAPAKDANDHSIWAEEFEFSLFNPVLIGGRRVFRVKGGSYAMSHYVVSDNVENISVRAYTHKVGTVNHSKLIGRRSAEERRFLEDLVAFAIRSGAGPQEPFFSRWAKQPNGQVKHRKCQSKMVSGAIKETIALEGLDPAKFAFHSLRKASVTQMNALGVSKEDVNNRGNYAAESKVPDTTYNHFSSAVGPLAANRNQGRTRPGREDIAKLANNDWRL